MSKLDDLMTRLLGANWKTSLTAWATALSSFAAVILVAFGEGKWAIVAGAMSAIAKVLNGIVAADAEPAAKPVESPKTGGATFVMLCVMAATGMLVCFALTGCGTIMPKVQAQANRAAGQIPGGAKLLQQFRQ